MPVPASRLASCIGALSATVLVGGMCAGAAGAGPDEGAEAQPQQTEAQPASQDSKGNLIGATLGVVGSLTRGHGSAQPVRAALSVPRAVVGTVRNTTAGTVAGISARLAPRGQPQKVPPPVAAPPPVDEVVTTAAEALPVEAVPAPAEVVATVPVPQVVPLPLPPVQPVPAIPAPATAAFTIALPKIPFTPATVYAVDPTNPVVAYSAVPDTYETTNTLATDTVQPVNTLLGVEPEPEPEPETKVYEREGIAEAPAGIGFAEAPADPGIAEAPAGTGFAEAPAGPGFAEAPAEAPAPVDVAGTPPPSGSAGMDDLSVVRIPMVTAAAVRLAPPRPFSEATPAPAAAVPQGLVGGGAAPTVRGSETLVGGGSTVPAVRGSEVRTGTQSAETPLNASSPTANSPVRQGFPQYLRNARMVELTAVALPGLAGLLALTVSGGVVGYRQANSVRYLRADADRFLT